MTTIEPTNPIKLFQDGDRWCALLGEDLQAGQAVFSTDPIHAVQTLIHRLGIKDSLEVWAGSDISEKRTVFEPESE